MKILAIHSFTDDRLGHPVDLWRIYRPLNELAKHTDWEIVHQRSVVKNLEKYDTLGDFLEEDQEKAAEFIGTFDAVFISYWQLTAVVYAFLHVINQRYGTKIIIDLDDDLFDVPHHNPIWRKVTKLEMNHYQTCISLASYITTTNQHLANKIKEYNKDAKVFVIPNYIDSSYQHKSFDNKDRIVIGYFGGASHYRDLHRTGMLPALQKIMHEHKEVYFECVGQPVDYYLPTARVKVTEPVNGVNWPNVLFPTLNFDIALAPLQDDGFSDSKSNIKWQEATRMGAAFICSDVGPYRYLRGSAVTRVPKNTEEDWYKALKELVEDKNKRNKQLESAKEELKNWELENHWQEYKKMFEEVVNADNQTSK